MAENKKEIYLPILLKITEKKILMIGAGMACREKLRSLGQLGTEIQVIAPEIHPDFLDKPWIKLERRPYQTGDLAGFDIVYVGVNNPEVESVIRGDASGLNLLLNYVDKVEYSDFISPSVICRENFCVFVSTYGRGPGAAKKIRKIIEEKVDIAELDRETGFYIQERNARLGRDSGSSDSP